MPEPKPKAMVVSRPPTNSLGIAGVIISIVGLLTCGLLSPVGLLFSVLGLLNTPRGTALAGTVIGAFGTLLLTVVGLSVVSFVAVMGPGFASMRDALVGVGGSLAVKQFYDHHGRLPTDAEGQQALAETLGNVGLEVQYVRQDEDRFEIRLAGPDTKWDTADDRISKFSMAELQAAASGGADPAEAPIPGEADEQPAPEFDGEVDAEPAEGVAPEVEADPIPDASEPPSSGETPEESSLQPMNDIIFAGVLAAHLPRGRNTGVHAAWA